MTVRSLKRNFAINVAGALVPLFVSLLTVPIYIRHIGDARYGVLSIVWVLLGYFGFLDLGLSRAAANALARLRHAPQEQRARVLVTTFVLNLAMGLFGMAVMALVGRYILLSLLTVPDALKPEVASALPWIVLLLPLALVAGVGNGALESRERFDLTNIFAVCGVCMGQIVPVALAVFVSPSLMVVVPAAAVIRASTTFVLMCVVYRMEGPLSLGHFDGRQARALLSYGGWVSVSGIISPILTSIDQFIIGSILGVASVTQYAVPMNLVLRSQIIPGAFSRTLFPRMSSVSPEDARHLGLRALSAVAFGYAMICVPATVLMPVFFRFWIGPILSTKAAVVAEILFVGAWANATAFVAYSLLQSLRRPDITGKFHLLELGPFVAILWLLTQTFGIEGAALAWTLRSMVDALLLFRAARIPFDDLISFALPLGLFLFADLLAGWAGSEVVTAVGSALGMGVLTLVLALVMAPDLRRLATTTFDRLRRRKSLSASAH